MTDVDWETKFRSEKEERLALKKKQNEIEEQLKKTKAENARLERKAKDAAIAAQVAAASSGAAGGGGGVTQTTVTQTTVTSAGTATTPRPALARTPSAVKPTEKRETDLFIQSQQQKIAELEKDKKELRKFQRMAMIGAKQNRGSARKSGTGTGSNSGRKPAPVRVPSTSGGGSGSSGPASARSATGGSPLQQQTIQREAVATTLVYRPGTAGGQSQGQGAGAPGSTRAQAWVEGVGGGGTAAGGGDDPRHYMTPAEQQNLRQWQQTLENRLANSQGMGGKGGANDDFKAPDGSAFDAGGVPPPAPVDPNAFGGMGGELAAAGELVMLRKRVHELQGKCTFLTSQFDHFQVNFRAEKSIQKQTLSELEKYKQLYTDSQREIRECRSRLKLFDISTQQIQELTMQRDHLTAENEKLTNDMKVMTHNMLHGDAIGKEQLNNREKHWTGQAATLKGDLQLKHKEATDLRQALKDQKAAHDDAMSHAGALQKKLADAEAAHAKLRAEKAVSDERVARFSVDSGVDVDTLERALDLVKRQQEARFLYAPGTPSDIDLSKLDNNQLAQLLLRERQEFKTKNAELVVDLQTRLNLFNAQVKLNRDLKAQLLEEKKKNDQITRELHKLRSEAMDRPFDDEHADMLDVSNDDIDQWGDIENLVAIRITGAHFNSECELFDSNAQAPPLTFVAIHFYKHQTIISPPKGGFDPDYQFTAQYKVDADLQFQTYLAEKAVTILVYRQKDTSNADLLGRAVIPLRELMGPDARSDGKCEIVFELAGSQTRVIAGELTYALRMLRPITSAPPTPSAQSPAHTPRGKNAGDVNASSSKLLISPDVKFDERKFATAVAANSGGGAGAIVSDRRPAKLHVHIGVEVTSCSSVDAANLSLAATNAYYRLNAVPFAHRTITTSSSSSLTSTSGAAPAAVSSTSSTSVSREHTLDWDIRDEIVMNTESLIVSITDESSYEPSGRPAAAASRYPDDDKTAAGVASGALLKKRHIGTFELKLQPLIPDESGRRSEFTVPITNRDNVSVGTITYTLAWSTAPIKQQPQPPAATSTGAGSGRRSAKPKPPAAAAASGSGSGRTHKPKPAAVTTASKPGVGDDFDAEESTVTTTTTTTAPAKPIAPSTASAPNTKAGSKLYGDSKHTASSDAPAAASKRPADPKAKAFDDDLDAFLNEADGGGADAATDPAEESWDK